MHLVMGKMVQGILPYDNANKKRGQHLLPPEKPITHMLTETWSQVVTVIFRV